MECKTSDIVIKGGAIVDVKEIRKGDLFIQDGLVDSIEISGSTRSARKIIDAKSKFILPGAIDVHVHPVYADRIDTVSQSAAYGGVTTLIPYMGSIKAWGKSGGPLEVIRNFIEEGEKTSVVDFGVHCSLVHDDMETVDTLIPKLVEMGVTSFKTFMAYSKRGMKLEDGELMKVMEIIVKNKGLFAAHAENGAIIDYLEGKFISQGNLGPEFFLPSHPNMSEAEAVFRIATLASIMHCPLYLPHLSAKESMEVVKMFKRWGEPKLFAETCPHYLTITDDEMTKRGSLAKVGPPLRKKEDVEAMWVAMKEGLIDVIGSDAAGYLVKNKEPIWKDIFEAPFGLPGVETMLTIVYDEGVNKGKLTLPQLVKMMSENPARIFGLYPKKGVLEKGSDADLVIFDPFLSHTIKAETQHLKSDYNMYEGRECLGTPVLVMQRGNILVEDGKLKAEPGVGKYLPRRLK